jgi:hypothetical protein
MNSITKTNPIPAAKHQSAMRATFQSVINFALNKLNDFPALAALVVQALALLMVGLLAWASYAVSLAVFDLYIVLPLLLMVVLQAVLAASLAKWIGMATWWRWIHFFFPITASIMLMFQVPNELYLIGFMVTLSMFWTTFRTQVPYYPSRLNTWEKVSSMTHQYEAEQSHAARIIDIGSGLGGFSMHLAKMHPNTTVEGIEVAPLPWLTSRISALIKRSGATFKLGDYQKLDFAQYDIIFAYLSPAAMEALWLKSSQEMGQGCLLISLEFQVPDATPTQHILGDGTSPDIYVYQF